MKRSLFIQKSLSSWKLKQEEKRESMTKKFLFELQDDVAEEVMGLVKGGVQIRQMGKEEVYAITYDIHPSPLRIREQKALYESLSLHWMLLEKVYCYKSADLTIIPSRQVVIKDGKQRVLNYCSFVLLMELISHPFMTATRNGLLSTLENNQKMLQDNTLTAHIGRLRKLLGSYQGKPLAESYIVVHRHFGYKWIHPVRKVKAL